MKQAHPDFQFAACLYRLGAKGPSTVRYSTSLVIGDGTLHLYFERHVTAML